MSYQKLYYGMFSHRREKLVVTILDYKEGAPFAFDDEVDFATVKTATGSHFLN